MPKLGLGILLIAILAAFTTCRLGAAETNPRVHRSVITRSQLLEHRFTTALDAVQALRSNWLNTRGTDSFTNPGEVQVYLDNNHLGGMAGSDAGQLHLARRVRRHHARSRLAVPARAARALAQPDESPRLAHDPPGRDHRAIAAIIPCTAATAPRRHGQHRDALSTHA